ncbi:hypothetical protein ABW20_dc0109873 [Dactylellina cionopaga]|nr:hypothetical protein ABW20_dc0109873 [Dactylellina cionopaga]
MGIAVYSGQIEVYKCMQQRIPNYQNLIVSTIAAAAHRGNLEVLEEIFHIVENNETKFVHLGKTSNGYMNAGHWIGVLDNWIIYNTQTIHGGTMAIPRLAAASQASAIHHLLLREIGWTPAQKHSALKQALCMARDVATVKEIWQALKPLLTLDSKRRDALQMTAFVSVTSFGDPQIMGYLLDQGLNAEEVVSYTIDFSQGGIKKANQRELLLNTAVTYGRKAVVELLLQRGVRPNLTFVSISSSIGDAMSCAIASGRKDMEKLLLDYGYVKRK